MGRCNEKKIQAIIGTLNNKGRIISFKNISKQLIEIIPVFFMKTRSNQTSLNSFFNEIPCLVTCILMVQILSLKKTWYPMILLKQMLNWLGVA